MYVDERRAVMPYRLKPSDNTVVQVKVKGGWVDKKKFKSKGKALKHLQALEINVEGAHK